MKMLSRALVLLCFFALRPAQAFVDPPWITPENPQAGEEVFVHLRYGICDVILLGPIPPEITQSGTSIRILFWSVHNTDPILCNYPIEAGTTLVGALPPGDYTLQVDRWYQDGLSGETTTETLGVVPFTVEGGASPPTSVPVGGRILIVLSLLVALLGISRLYGARWLLPAIAGLVVLPIARASDVRPSSPELPPNRAIELLVRVAPGAPSVEDLVRYAATPDGVPPLNAFAAVPPESVVYAMPIRAEGDFREWLNANPESPRARLERYVLVY